MQLELGDDDIAKLYGQGMTRGAVVWRKGMVEWRPLLITPELTGLLRRTRTTLAAPPTLPYVADELTLPRPAPLPSELVARSDGSEPPPPERQGFTTVAPTAMDVEPERKTQRRRIELLAVAAAAFALAWVAHGRLQQPQPDVASASLAVTPAAPAAPTPACEPPPSKSPSHDAQASSSIPTVSLADLPLAGATTTASTRRASTGRSTRPSRSPERSDGQGPTRAELSAALAQVANAAAGCGERDGAVRVVVSFAPSGVARSIQVSGAGLPAQTRSCIIGAASRARVPAFSGDTVTVSKTL